MIRLKHWILIPVMLLFIFSCMKKYDPPALGDHTKPDTTQSTGTGKKVLTLPADWGDIFKTGQNGKLYVRNKDKVFNVYTPGADGVFGVGTPFPGTPWDASANLYYMGLAQNVQTVMVVNVPPAGMFRFDAAANGMLTMHPTTNAADPFPTNFGFWYGDGWDKYNIIAFNGKFVFQIAHNQGEALLRSPFAQFTDDWSTWNRPATLQRDDTGKKFEGYRSAMAMGNHLLIITRDGDLMAYAVDDSGNLNNGTKIGSGWSTYTRTTATGNDILGINSKGEVFRHTIDVTKTTNNAG